MIRQYLLQPRKAQQLLTQPVISHVRGRGKSRNTQQPEFHHVRDLSHQFVTHRRKLRSSRKSVTHRKDLHPRLQYVRNLHVLRHKLNVLYLNTRPSGYSPHLPVGVHKGRISTLHLEHSVTNVPGLAPRWIVGVRHLVADQHVKKRTRHQPVAEVQNHIVGAKSRTTDVPSWNARARNSTSRVPLPVIGAHWSVALVPLRIVVAISTQPKQAHATNPPLSWLPSG